MPEILVGDVSVDVTLKEIKNVHLSVHPPTGRVRISAPTRMSLENIRIFAISKLGWIREQQRKFQEQERETPREFLERESHYVWGKRYLLTLEEGDHSPSVDLRHRRLVMRVRPGTDETKRQVLMDEWYREQLKQAVPPLVALWEPRIGVELNRFYVQRMKTKWGSCSPDARTIRLNTELAKKPRDCLEYIVVHELVHLREPTHNSRFVALMDELMPNWRLCRQRLNELPVRHEDWRY